MFHRTLSFFNTEKTRHILRFIIIIACTILSFSEVHAATYYSRISGTFNTAGTWSINPGGSPTNTTAIGNGDIFIIQNTHIVTMGATRTIAQLTVNSGGTLAFQTYTLTISGNCLNNGTMSGTTGQITNSTALFTNNGTFTYTTGRINKTTGDLINNGSISGTSGRITLTTGDFTNAATATVNYTATAVITLGTGNFTNNNTSANVNFGSAVVTISGTAAAQTIGGFVTNGRLSCTKTAGTVTLTGDVTANGFTMNGSGGTMSLGTGLNHTTIGTVILTTGTLKGGSSTINVNIVSTSAWGGSSAAVFQPETGTVILGANGAQRLSASGTKTFYNLSFANTGLKTITTTVVNNIFSMEGSATASAAPTYGTDATLRYNTSTPRTAGIEWITPFVATGGVLIDNTGAISANANKVFSTDVPLTINTNATLTTNANDFTFGGNFVNDGTWTPSSGDVTITGTSAQNIGGFITTGTLFMTKTSGIAILQGNVNGGSFTLNGSGGTLRLGAGLTHSFTGTWTNTNGTLRGNTSILNIAGSISGSGINFIPNNSTVNFTGASSQNIPDFTYNNLGFSGAGLKTLTGATTVQEVLTINASTELNLSSFTLNLEGNGTPLVNDGIFTASTSTVNYTNATSATIAAVDYYNLNATGGDRTFAPAGNIGIANIFTAGGGSYTVTNSTVDFNGSGIQTIPAFTFYNLIVSNAGIKHVMGNTTVACRSINVEDDASVEINADGGGRLSVLD